MANRDRLKKILEVLDPNVGTSVDFSQFDAEVNKLKEALTFKIQSQTIEDVNTQLDKFKKKLKLDPILEAVSNLETTLEAKIQGVTGRMIEESASLKKLLTQQTEVSNQSISSVASNIGQLKQELAALTDQKNKELGDLKSKVLQLQDQALSATESLLQIQDSLEESGQESEDELKKYNQELETMRRDFINRLNNLPHGGNMNRNIAIGGNTSVLAKYTDLNIKAGANVILTYSNNETSKYLDLTIAATGGGSVSGGTVRSINNINTSQSLGSTSQTDYVYVCSAGIQVTMPDPTASNTNLYTVKNTSTSSILVSPFALEKIDGQNNLILATQYTSVDLVSDGTNWEIT